MVKLTVPPQLVLSDLRKNAVKETEVKYPPNNPIKVDESKGNDQYGIRGDKLKELQEQIKKGSGWDAHK